MYLENKEQETIGIQWQSHNELYIKFLSSLSYLITIYQKVNVLKNVWCRCSTIILQPRKVK